MRGVYIVRWVQSSHYIFIGTKNSLIIVFFSCHDKSWNVRVRGDECGHWSATQITQRRSFVDDVAVVPIIFIFFASNNKIKKETFCVSACAWKTKENQQKYGVRARDCSQSSHKRAAHQRRRRQCDEDERKINWIGPFRKSFHYSSLGAVTVRQWSSVCVCVLSECQFCERIRVRSEQRANVSVLVLNWLVVCVCSRWQRTVLVPVSYLYLAHWR